MRISTYIRRTDSITALTAILFPICLPRPVGRADLCSHHGLDLLLWLSQPVLGAGTLCRAGRGITGAGQPEAAEELIGADAYGAFYAAEFSVGVCPYELNLCKCPRFEWVGQAWDSTGTPSTLLMHFLTNAPVLHSCSNTRDSFRTDF